MIHVDGIWLPVDQDDYCTPEADRIFKSYTHYLEFGGKLKPQPYIMDALKSLYKELPGPMGEKRFRDHHHLFERILEHFGVQWVDDRLVEMIKLHRDKVSHEQTQR